MEVPAGTFKAQCLRLMDLVQASREPIVVTKRGRPVAKLVPIDDVAPPGLFGYLRGSVAVHGDLVAPMGEAWDADA